MHIQLSEAMFAALTASQLGYIMKQRGEVEIKVRYVRTTVKGKSYSKIYLKKLQFTHMLTATCSD